MTSERNNQQAFLPAAAKQARSPDGLRRNDRHGWEGLLHVRVFSAVAAQARLVRRVGEE
jgi:hypothetical protein